MFWAERILIGGKESWMVLLAFSLQTTSSWPLTQTPANNVSPECSPVSYTHAHTELLSILLKQKNTDETILKIHVLMRNELALKRHQ